MKRFVPLLMLVVVVGGRAFGAGPDAESDYERFQQQQLASKRPTPAPKVDAKGLVKASTSILHEREPDLTPDEYAIYQKLAAMLTTDPKLAMKLLEAMMGGKQKPSPAFEFVLGNAYYEAGQMKLAEKYYRSAVRDYPDFLRAWKNLGVLYYSTNRPADAVECFAKAVTLGDRDPSTLGLLGYCLEMRGNLVGAETDFLQAAGLDPTNTDWQEGLLRIYIKGKEYGRAEPLVRRLLKAKPTDANLWLDYAGILIAEHRKVEAMAVLETAQAAGAAGPNALVLLGDLYAEQGLAPEAAATYAKLLGPAHALGQQKLIFYARVLISSGNLAEAERVLADVPGNLKPANRIALLQTRADLAMAKKHWPEARREIEALLSLAPLNGRALLTLGRTYLEEKDLERANFAYQEASRIPECAYEATVELANLAVRTRHYAKAVAYLEKALRLHQSDPVADYLAQIRTLVHSENKSS